MAPAAELKIHRHEGPVLERHEEVLEVEVAVREDDLAADARRESSAAAYQRSVATR